MPQKRGQYFVCKYCDETFYKRPSHVRRGITKTCGKRECISQSMQGSNNPFWGKNHTDATRAELKKMRNSKPSRPYGTRKYGPAKGGFKHTPQARAAIAADLRQQWRVNRDKRMAAVAKAVETRRTNKLNEEPRYRLQFTPWQRQEWTAKQCAWCDATDDLVLDHIIPVMAGGTNRRANAQTLCRTCNLWKMRYVDRPLLLSMLDNKGAELQPGVPERSPSVTLVTSQRAGGATSSDHPL